ncbi:MAG: IclR family transcriptional regulator [Anaerolineae bacterium]|nr:IclR family transcriptional regulator [Anaerolineae bacterium]
MMQNNTTMRNKNIQSIERAFLILQTIAGHPAGLGVTSIAHKVDLPKSTVARFLTSLETVQAIERLSTGEGYGIGPGLMALVSQMPFSRHLITLARPYLDELSQATGESVFLCVLDGDQAHYIDQVNSVHHVQIQDWTDSRFPLHVTSNGKIFLASWPEAQLARYLSRPLERYTANTITDPERMRQHLVQVKDQGYAWVNKEFDDEVAGLAVPIVDGRGAIVASISLGGPCYRFPPEGQTEEMIALITTIGRKISRRIRENR